MKQDQIVAAIAQRLHGFDDDFGLLVEIRDHHHDAAPPQELLKMDERLGEIGMRAGLRLLDGVRHAHELALARGGLDVVAHFVVEDDHAGGVALLIGEIGQRNGQKRAVVQLGDAGASCSPWTRWYPAST